MLKLWLCRNVRKQLLWGDTTDPSSDKEPAQAVPGELIPGCAKRRAAWSRMNVGTESATPLGSARALSSVWVSTEQVALGGSVLPGLSTLGWKREIAHHLTGPECSKANLAHCTLVHVKEL